MKRKRPDQKERKKIQRFDNIKSDEVDDLVRSSILQASHAFIPGQKVVHRYSHQYFGSVVVCVAFSTESFLHLSVFANFSASYFLPIERKSIRLGEPKRNARCIVNLEQLALRKYSKFT